MNIADIEREKALKSRQPQPEPVEEKTEPITNQTADIEKAKALKSREPEVEPDTTPPRLNTQTQDPSRFGKGEDYEGNFDPYKKGILGTIKDKLGDIKQRQVDTATENAQPPETRYDLAGKTLENANDLGLSANRAIQNTEIPKWKRATLNDVLFNPEYKGIRDSIISQAINARGANFMKGLAGKEGNYESAIDKYNKEQAQRYSDAIADRDTRAGDIQMQDIEAANKRDVGEELQRADTVLGRELDRWGLLYDTETKKQVLNQMVKDSKEFASKVPDPADRLLLTAYQQYLSGDASALDSIISVYGPEILEKVDPLLEKLGLNGGTEATETRPNIVIGGKTYTPQEIDNLGGEGVDRLLKGLTLEEQKEVVENLEKGFGTKDKTVKNVRKAYDERQSNADKEKVYNAEKIKQSEEKGDYINEYITEVEQSDLKPEQKVEQLKSLKNEMDGADARKDFVKTDKLDTAITNLDNSLAKAKLAVEIKAMEKPFGDKIKLNIDGNGNLDQKNAFKTMQEFAKIDWNKFINTYTQSVTDRQKKLDAVKGTKAYKDLVNFFSNDKVKAYAYKDEARNTYLYAIDNFIKTFGGTRKDYNFLDLPLKE